VTSAVCSALPLTQTIVDKEFTGTADCPAGMHACGGGWKTSGVIQASKPADASDTSWTVTTRTPVGFGEVYAVCAGPL
jgi:hypothetical protein